MELFCLHWESASNKGLKGLEAKKLNCKQKAPTVSKKSFPQFEIFVVSPCLIEHLNLKPPPPGLLLFWAPGPFGPGSPKESEKSPKGCPGASGPRGPRSPQRVRPGVRKESKKSPKLRFWTLFGLRGALSGDFEARRGGHPFGLFGGSGPEGPGSPL